MTGSGQTFGRTGTADFDLAYSRPRKRSLTIAGHRTSVSLEDPFWDGLRRIAQTSGRSLGEIVTEVDRARGTMTGLASALRIYVLEWYRRRATLAPGQLGATHPGTDDRHPAQGPAPASIRSITGPRREGDG